MRALGTALSYALVLTGCGMVKAPGIADPGVICTAIAVSSLNVSVRDVATGAPVCDASVMALHATGAGYVLRRTGVCTYAGPEERAGDFEVIVTRDGYRAVRLAGIHVTADECHVIPVAVTVDIRPEP